MDYWDSSKTIEVCVGPAYTSFGLAPEAIRVGNHWRRVTQAFSEGGGQWSWVVGPIITDNDLVTFKTTHLMIDWNGTP